MTDKLSGGWVRQVAHLLFSLTTAHKVTEALGQLLVVAALCVFQAVVAVSYLHSLVKQYVHNLALCKPKRTAAWFLH